MSKSRTTKSVAAVGAGILLLTAAGGTFARWSQTENLNAQEITSGHLEMTFDGGQWWDVNAEKEITPSDFRVVPGDVLEYRVNITPTLIGDHLEAELKTELPEASGSLAEFVDTTTELDGAATQTLTPADSGTAIPAVVRVEMPYGAAAKTAPNKGQDSTLNLSALEVSLVQTPNP